MAYLLRTGQLCANCPCVRGRVTQELRLRRTPATVELDQLVDGAVVEVLGSDVSGHVDDDPQLREVLAAVRAACEVFCGARATGARALVVEVAGHAPRRF